MADSALLIAGIAVGAGGGLLTQLIGVAAFLGAMGFTASALDAGDELPEVGGLFGTAAVLVLLGTLQLAWFGTREPSGLDEGTIESVLFTGFAVTFLIEAIAAMGCIGLAAFFLAKGKLWRFGGSLAALASLILIGGAQFVGMLALLD